MDAHAPASWRRYEAWAPLASRIALIGGVICVPLCAVLPLGFLDMFWLDDRLGFPDGGFAAGAYVIGPVLAIVTVLCIAAVYWLRPGTSPPPRIARAGLVLGFVGLGTSLLALALLLIAVLQNGGME
jgi:hypothetical protein